MKPIQKMMTASAAVLSTLGFVAFAAPGAQAGEYCTTNTSGMRGCPYATMEQCQAGTAGIGGSCYRDPFLKDASNAQAYQPKPIRAHRAPRQPAEH